MRTQNVQLAADGFVPAGIVVRPEPSTAVANAHEAEMVSQKSR